MPKQDKEALGDNDEVRGNLLSSSI